MSDRRPMKGIERWFFLPALAAYGFSVQFGNYFRFSDAEVVPGVSTGLGIMIIAVGLVRAAQAVAREPIFQAFMFLILWIALATVVSDSSEYRLLGNFCGYVMLAAVASRTPLPASAFRFFWIAISIGMAISASLTIIDYVGLYNVPRNNDILVSSEIGSSRVQQATGFFRRRTAMAAVFSSVIAGSVLLGILERKWRLKMLFWSCGTIGALCVLLTHNRSGVLASLIALAFYTSVLIPGGISRRLIISMAGITSAIIIVLIMWSYFPEHLEVYQSKLGHLLPGSEQSAPRNVAKSDYGRVRIFLAAVESLPGNPIGNGFGLVRSPEFGSKGSHNIITTFIWAAGVMFILWLPIFLWFLVKRLRYVAKIGVAPGTFQYFEATKCGLIAFFLNNMVHEGWGTGLAWILFGTLIATPRVGRLNSQPQNDPLSIESHNGAVGSAPRTFATASKSTLKD